jgi:hypothetical protein
MSDGRFVRPVISRLVRFADATSLGGSRRCARFAINATVPYRQAADRQALDHAVLQAEAEVTMVDGVLAAAIPCRLILNAALGWWGADIVDGIVVVACGLRKDSTQSRIMLSRYRRDGATREA